MKDLFGEETYLDAPIGEKRHDTRRVRQPKANGYAWKPATGPEGETCGSCKHRVRMRRWSKCGLVRGLWTGGRRTDILVSSPACKRWEAL